MTKPLRAAVVVFPGSNREGDVARALRQATGEAPAMVWHADSALPPGTDLVVLPGGFSYGDYLRCGAIAARARIMDALVAHAERGGLTLGICNGFQILCEAGLLPGVLMRNARRRFVCQMQHLKVENAQTPFARRYRPGQVIKVAIAHGEGNYTIDAAGLADARARRPRRLPLLRRRRRGRRRSQSQRLGQCHRRRLQRALQRARADAAPGEPDRSAGRGNRRPRHVRGPRGLRRRAHRP